MVIKLWCLYLCSLGFRFKGFGAMGLCGMWLSSFYFVIENIRLSGYGDTWLRRYGVYSSVVCNLI